MASEERAPGLVVRLLALRLLERVDDEGAWLSRMIGAELKRSGLSGADARLVTHLTQTVLRRRPALHHVITACARQGRVPQPVERLLELGLAQILFMDRVPDHAAVDCAVRSARRSGQDRHTGLINGILRRVARERTHWTQVIESDPALLGPASRVLFDRWSARWGLEATTEFHRQLGRPARVDVRVDRGALSDWCETLDGTPLPGMPPRLCLAGGAPEGRAGFAEGDWTVQDRNAARIVPILPEGGRRIADLCAAPGGKTTQLGFRFPEAELTAIELHEHRAGLVRAALARCSLKGRVEVGDACELAPQLGPFDRMIVDAPCSGFGTLRRHPEIAVRSMELKRNATLQGRLLDAASAALSVGGYLVYSVCSLEPEEGYDVVRAALARLPLNLVPHDDLPEGQGCFGLDGDGDGFFVALMEKKA